MEIHNKRIKELEKEPKSLESKTEELSTLDIPY
jgi:hypothetical protein